MDQPKKFRGSVGRDAVRDIMMHSADGGVLTGDRECNNDDDERLEYC